MVDDDRRIRELLSRFLTRRATASPRRSSAAEARANLEGLSFDLLILDVMMPGETGFEFARKLRTSSTVPILMLTARGEAESRIQGLEIGADDYVGKPFEPRRLLLRIASILKRARSVAAPPVEFVRFGEFVFHIGRGRAQPRRRCRPSHRPRARDADKLLAANPATRCPGSRWPERRRQWRERASSGNAPSTCRSTGSVARSSAILPIRSCADRAWGRLPAGDDAMTALDTGMAALRSAGSSAALGRRAGVSTT